MNYVIFFDDLGIVNEKNEMCNCHNLNRVIVIGGQNAPDLGCEIASLNGTSRLGETFPK